MWKMRPVFIQTAIIVTLLIIGIGLISRKDMMHMETFQNSREMAISRSLQSKCLPEGTVIPGNQVDMYKEGFNVQHDPAFLQYIRQHWLHGPSRKKTTLSTEDQSQYGEFTMVDKLLNHKRNGFFFECGALDGQWLSSSAAFEMQRNWTGLLVEANPYAYRNLLKKQRNTYSINACLSTNSQNATEIVSFLPAGAIGGVKEAIKDGNLQAALKENKGKGEVPVQCFPVYSILLAVGQTKIDFFSLDIEGLELEVLKTMPMDKLDIDIFVIEFNMHDQEKQAMKLQSIKDFFKSLGGYTDLGTHAKNVVFQKIK